MPTGRVEPGAGGLDWPTAVHQTAWELPAQLLERKTEELNLVINI